MQNTETESQRKHTESYRYHEGELDLMDAVPPPRLNPWLSLGLLVLAGFIYVWIWEYLLRG